MDNEKTNLGNNNHENSNPNSETMHVENDRNSGDNFNDYNSCSGKNKYSGNQYQDRWAEFRDSSRHEPQKKKKKTGLIVFFIILTVLVAFSLLYIFYLTKISASDQKYNSSTEHIAVIDITGQIGENDLTQIYNNTTYNQNWLIDTIDTLSYIDQCKAIVLYLDTPGGSVYETDEVYLKLMEYKSRTKKPVYAIMGPTCASGGYYIACAADKIFANRNTMTGSIGVTMGTSIDISDLLSKYGIKTTTLTSGRNKAMGSIFEPMTEEQAAIYQSILDEAYNQFTSIVAAGRNMDIETVKVLADGRVYTANQAKNNGLIDEISNYDDSIKIIQSELNMPDCDISRYTYSNDTNIYNMIFGIANQIKGIASESNDDLSTALKMAEDSKLTPCYLAR